MVGMRVSVYLFSLSSYDSFWSPQKKIRCTLSGKDKTILHQLLRTFRRKWKATTVDQALHALTTLAYKYILNSVPTIMDKSVGTVVHFERLLTHAISYPRATNTPHPNPLPPPHGQCWNRQGTIPLIFQHCIGWGGEGAWICKMTALLFVRHCLWNA